MGEDQRDSVKGFQGAEERQEAVERGWKSGDQRCRKGPMGQSKRNQGHTEGSQENRSADEPGGQGQACGGRQGKVGKGEGAGEKSVIAFALHRELPFGKNAGAFRDRNKDCRSRV